jgi:hypothetical protein
METGFHIPTMETTDRCIFTYSPDSPSNIFIQLAKKVDEDKFETISVEVSYFDMITMLKALNQLNPYNINNDPV